MKKKVVHYTIDDPCHENWSTMTPVEQGRFCNSCAKTVVDFTSMTDFDVMNYMSAATGSVCARMTNSQLNRDFTRYETAQTQAFSMRALVLGAALSTFSALNSCAQTETHNNETKPVHHNHPHKVGKVAPVQNRPVLPDSVLAGYVKDENNRTVSGVKVTLYEGEKILVETTVDASGKYKLIVPVAAKPSSVVFRAAGYDEKTFPYKIMADSHKEEMVFLKKEDEIIINGGVEMHDGPADSRKRNNQ